MKTILRVVLWLVVLAGPSTFACSPPPPETVALTWQPLAKITVIPDIDSITAATTAMNDWNTATFYYCYAPIFTFGPGTGETMTVSYVAIAPDPNGTIPRGKTLITTSGRITSASVYLNNAILLTFPLALADVMDHEIGHTMGLNDCNYPGCPLYSSVMENLAPVPIWGIQGPTPSGPTACDLAVMSSVASDYNCPPPPPPPPPPPDCSCCSGPRPASFSLGALGAKLLETPQQKDVKFRGPQSCYYTCPCCPAACSPQSPIILDVTGGGFFLTDAAHGVLFDLRGAGKAIQVAWTAPGAENAFLCLPDANGSCDDGKNLFGNFTPQPASDTPNGFAALAVYDQPANGGNGDGVIDSRDAIFNRLRLWIDANHDGISQPTELYTLPSLGISSISLNYKWDRRTDQYGNIFRYRAQVGSTSGAGRMAYDVFLVIQTSNGSTVTAQSCPAVQPPLLPAKKGLLLDQK